MTETKTKQKPDHLEGELPGWFAAIVRWRETHISERNFIILLAFIVGVISGTAALALKYFISLISRLLTMNVVVGGYSFWLFILPAMGVGITALYVKFVVKDNISHGVTRVLYAISQKKSRLKKHNIYTSVVASSITIGFGGSVGAEGPIVYTGAAIGSNLGSLFRMPPRVLMLMVGCGAAAGIAGIFKAPIAGMLFTLEVLMLDLTTVSIMPLLISSVTAATMAYIFTGYDFEFQFEQSEFFFANRIPYVILLGGLCCLVSIYFTKVMNMMENMFKRLKKTWLKFIVGATVLSTLVFLFPALYGEGYEAIINLLAGDPSILVEYSPLYADRDNPWIILLFVGGIILTKCFATSATNGGGGVGGTFAPSLFVGCMTGFFFAFLLNHAFGLDLSTKNFALMGMTGVMAGVMHAPLMAIFLTAELTGGYDLFLPLLIVSAISYGTTKMVLPYSIYAMRLAQRGELMTHHKDKTVLTMLKIDSLIEREFLPVTPEMSLKEMVDVISKSSRNLFPVLDNDKKLIGIVVLDEIRNIMFRTDLYRRMKVRKFMSMPPARIVLGDSMENVMKTFDDTQAWNLPVVDAEGRYEGFVSKSKIFNSYRRVLRHYSDD
ncbi:MAG: chloride channel protein [Muribaculaceae bacterium]|nr:chloride channel protein [Muribaculaceae bacterium]